MCTVHGPREIFWMTWHLGNKKRQYRYVTKTTAAATNWLFSFELFLLLLLHLLPTMRRGLVRVYRRENSLVKQFSCCSWWNEQGAQLWILTRRWIVEEDTLRPLCLVSVSRAWLELVSCCCCCELRGRRRRHASSWCARFSSLNL